MRRRACTLVRQFARSRARPAHTKRHPFRGTQTDSSNPKLGPFLLAAGAILIAYDMVSRLGMHKDELLQLHSLLCQMKRYFEDCGLPMGEFREYEDLQVSPQHIHKSKTDHKQAVFLLGKGLAGVSMMSTPDHQARLKERFLRLAAVREVEEEDPTPAPTNEPRRDSHLPAFALAALRQ